MLSSDKNVETIAQLAEVVKDYIGLQAEYLKLDVIDKLVRLLKALALVAFFFLIIMAVVLYLSLAVAFWLSAYVGYVAAFTIVGALHLLLFLLLMLKSKAWIERPLVRFLSELFFGN